MFLKNSLSPTFFFVDVYNAGFFLFLDFPLFFLDK